MDGRSARGSDSEGDRGGRVAAISLVQCEQAAVLAIIVSFMPVDDSILVVALERARHPREAYR